MVIEMTQERLDTEFYWMRLPGLRL